MRRHFMPVTLPLLATAALGLLRAMAGEGAAAAASGTVRVDYHQAPECAAFALKAGALIETWYPRINRMLNGTNAPLPYPVVFLEFVPMDGVAATLGNHITVSAEWVTKKATNDYGMVIHELTHVVQDYQGKGEGWLTEGIADYVRDWQFEPGARPIRIDPATNRYQDGYSVTAAFLAWLQKNKCPDLVSRLSLGSRQGADLLRLFEQCCGKNLDALWQEFLAAAPRGGVMKTG